jgi:hypothetical protein
MKRVGRAAVAARVAAAAGFVALIAFGVFDVIGRPFDTLGDIALLVMTLAIAPIMLGFYELGGRTPLTPARLALGTGIGSVIAWSVIHAAILLGAVEFHYDRPATGLVAVRALLTVAIGSWLVGAPLLAGPWLPTVHRWLGVACGLGFIAFGIGLVLGGVDHPLYIAGAAGYLIAFPIWAFLMGRVFTRVDETRGIDQPPQPA